MADEDDQDLSETEEEDPYRLIDLIGKEMTEEIEEICDRAHTLLAGEVIGGQGDAPLQRVCLDIPEGLLLVAQYIVGREYYNQPWEWMHEALKDKGREGKAVRAVVHDRLTKYMRDALHEELHWLSTRNHRIISAEATRQDRNPEKPEQG